MNDDLKIKRAIIVVLFNCQPTPMSIAKLTVTNQFI